MRPAAVIDSKWHKGWAPYADARWNVIMFQARAAAGTWCPRGPYCRESNPFYECVCVCVLFTHHLLPWARTTPAEPLGRCIDPPTLYIMGRLKRHNAGSKELRSLVLPQPLLMQLTHYLAESVIRTCTIQTFLRDAVVSPGGWREGRLHGVKRKRLWKNETAELLKSINGVFSAAVIEAGRRSDCISICVVFKNKRAGYWF